MKVGDDRSAAPVDPVLLNPDFYKIHYFVPHPAEDGAEGSYFQAFTTGILETADLFDFLPYLPADVRELYAAKEDIVRGRILGMLRYRVAPLQVQFLTAGCHMIRRRTPFICVMSNQGTVAAVDEAIGKVPFPVIHLSTEPGQRRVALTGTTKAIRGAMYQYVDEVLRVLRGTNDERHVVDEIEKTKDSKERIKAKNTGIQSSNHLVARAGERMLDSLGYTIRAGAPIPPSSSDGPYLQAIFRVHDYIVGARAKVLGSKGGLPHRVGNSLIVTVPSLLIHHYRKPDLDGVEPKFRDEVELIHEHLRKQYTFTTTTKDSARFVELLKSESGRAILGLRQQELNAYTAGITIAACNEFLPVLRLSPSINRVRFRLRQIGDCARGMNPHQQFKLNKLAGALVAEMEKSIDQRYLDRIDSPYQRIKLVADLPLEWLPIRGLPLMLRYDCSRYATTPGNVFFAQCLAPPDVYLKRNAFSEVLVVRSFKENDPIRRSLENAIAHLTVDYPRERFHVRFVDVASEAEFCDAVNAFDGAILIFDGHGRSGGEQGVGGIVVGGNVLDVWALRGKVRVPPIVILSACDTFPVDGSHASPANGFLVLGARTVLATLLPIAANLAAMYITRLLLRVAEFVPIVTQVYDQKIRWSSVVAGFQRMSYVTELVHAINGKKGCALSDNDVSDIGLLANKHINTNDEEWYERVIEAIAQRAGSEVAVIRELVTRWAKLTDTLKYVQLGNPEKIIVINKSLELLDAHPSTTGDTGVAEASRP